MKDNDDETHGSGGQKTLWGFLTVGILMLLAGIFIQIPGESGSLPKAEILTGACLIIGALAALVITS